MNLAFQIARRYLFSKKSTNAINIITLVSMGGIMVCSAAFILILSVFNGFEGLVISLYDTFYADIKIEAKEGKVFTISDEKIAEITELKGVNAVSKVLEENALLMYSDRQHIATVRGVDENYIKVTGIDTSIAFGDSFVVDLEGQQYAILGSGIDQALEVSLKDPLNKISVFMPNRGKRTSFFPVDEFRKREIMAWGIFAIQDDFDNQFMFVPLEFVQEILEYEDQISSIEVGLAPSARQDRVIREIEQIMGENFDVLSKYQQNAFLYRIMNIEKLAVYLILSFVLLIVAFNMIGSLSMVVIDKKEDIAILKTMGATDGLIKRIFLFEGVMQSLLALSIGFGIAITLLLAQIHYGIIEIQGSGTFVVQYYPVEMEPGDFIIVAVIVILISVFASWFPASRAARQSQLIDEE